MTATRSLNTAGCQAAGTELDPEVMLRIRPPAMSDITTGHATTAASPCSTNLAQDLANRRESWLSPLPSDEHRHEHQRVEHNEAAVDTLATAAFNDVPEHNIGYFGPTSNHALFRSLSSTFAHISRHSFPLQQHPTINPTRPYRDRTRPISTGSMQSQKILNIKPDVADLHAIPNGQDLALLMNQFFGTVGLTLPIIDRSAVLPEHNRSRELNGDQLSKPKLALIHVLCAYALSTLRNETAIAFYHRALLLLDDRTLRGSSLELVQVLLLLGSFQQNNQRSVASWTLHATAVKASFQLGLHSPRSYEDHGLHDSELRKRVWFAVINQDRSLSASLGRPCLIPLQYIRVQPPQDPSSILHILPTATPDHIDSLLYFNKTISLNGIKGSAIEVLYDYNIESLTPFTLDELIIKRIQLSSMLEQWRENSSSSSCHILAETDFGKWTLSSYSTNRFNILLSIQYYAMILLINGPILARLLQEGVQSRQHGRETMLLLETMIPMIKNDLSAAKELRELIHIAVTCSETFLDFNGAWWMCNYTMFTVILHLFGILLACKINDMRDIEMADIRSSLDSGLETLRLVERTSLMSRKAGDCLLGYVEIFDSLISDPSHQNCNDTNFAETTIPVSSNLSRDLMPENLFSQYIAQSADDFLLQCSDNAFLDADSEFFHNWN
ncbi:uncharacterized protein PAC_13416 [Phialocephala subalpina]|uniref:Xylanolytic transcriptional activator regulatory domain-containing protein n=1 Tax=Phialocephala subalpina TaxID=576137 RepID=A0A1L7XEP5_9HELO|nr:uncharacterized protein PAC_13416 [Phialocephala subalpina]